MASSLYGLIALAGIAVVAIWRAFEAGKTSQKTKQLQADANAMSEAQKIDDAVAGNAPDANREELSKWAK